MKVDKSKIEDLIRTKVSQGWTDRETATELGIGVATITHWRNTFNIRPADKFYRHFSNKYGKYALNDFCLMVEAGVSLKEIGDFFSFSREYSRLVHKKLYGRGRPRKYT